MAEKKGPILVIERKGKCLNCGYCCPPKCPHFDFPNCLIHDKKAEYCKTCKMTHQICLDAPIFPAGREKQDCGYKFMVKGHDLHAYEIRCSKPQSKK